ncbi:hypothetical protein BGW80DRAFT_1321979 [Lactifluus volemus]|nr:hypothetical protein BGW80DRAFT_1321979 [Lactifluus volemus]
MYCAYSRPAPYCKAPYLYIVMHDPRFAVFWTMNMNYLVFDKSGELLRICPNSH